MKLSKFFTLEELTVSQAAARQGLSNVPDAATLKTLTNTAKCLDAVRALLGVPIVVNSGYRSPLVNRAVGGASKSQHVEGKAVDFIAPKFGSPRQIVEKILSSNISFCQIILEFDSWVHISFSSDNRKQALVIDKQGTRIFS